MSAAAFSLQNIISLASRERCMTNLKKFRVPSFNRTSKSPPATAAVLIPLCHVNDQTSILYTVRATNLRSDSGLVAFPGGKTDNKESSVETALRETEEEIGLSRTKIDIWGQGQAVPGRNYISITPIVGFVNDLKERDLCINKNEVSEAFAVPLEILCNPKNQYYTQFQNGYVMPVFLVGEFRIWGVTAYMTHIFLSCLLPKDIYINEWMRKKIIINQ